MPSDSNKKQSSLDTIINWVLRLVPAVIVGRVALMKFTAGPKALMIFKSLDMEPGGRILIGVIETICVVLLLSSRISAWGAILCLGVMTGAVIAHVSVLGFDGAAGQLFIMAIITSISTLMLLYRLRSQVPFVSDMFDE